MGKKINGKKIYSNTKYIVYITSFILSIQYVVMIGFSIKHLSNGGDFNTYEIYWNISSLLIALALLMIYSFERIGLKKGYKVSKRLNYDLRENKIFLSVAICWFLWTLLDIILSLI